MWWSLSKRYSGFDKLIKALDPEKYPKARTYIENFARKARSVTWEERATLHGGDPQIRRRVDDVVDEYPV